MPFASNFLLTVIEGHFGTGTTPNDIWRTTFKNPTTDSSWSDEAERNAWIFAIDGPVSTFFTSLAAGSNTWLDSISAALVGPDGRYVGSGAQATVRAAVPGAPIQGSLTRVHPNEAALCVTFKTEFERGRASRGRMFWPATAQPVQASDGRLSPSQADTYATGAKTLIDAINTAATAAVPDLGRVSVMSSLGLGTTGEVEEVWVGSKLDHMGQREGELQEDYVKKTLAGVTLAVERRRRRVLGLPLED